MTSFALVYWTWEKTGAATPLALLTFFALGPTVLLSPLAGALADRYSRRVLMIASNVGAAASTAALLALHAADGLTVPAIYALQAVASAFRSLQMPALGASATLMVPRSGYARAAGLVSSAENSALLLGPVAAGLLLGPAGIAGVMAIDLATFVVATVPLLWAEVPQPAVAGATGRPSLWSDSLFGFGYIFARPGLAGLQAVLFAVNLMMTGSMALLPAMVLARTGSDELALGAVQSALGLGAIAGGVALGVWGGPRRRIHGVLVPAALAGLAGLVPLGLAATVPGWAVAGFALTLFLPVVNGCNQTIWQLKVAPEIQGRVFAARRLLAQISIPLAMLTVGPLADRLFEPAMAPGGALAGLAGGLVGTGPGAGIALMFLLSGVMVGAGGLAGYALPRLRRVESELPDHDAG
jgi:MFS family permease